MPSKPPKPPPAKVTKPRVSRAIGGHGNTAENDNFTVDRPVSAPPVWAIDLAKALARYRAGVAYRDGS